MQNPQQDLVRKTGMRAVRQACGKTFEEVEGFLEGESFPVVSKYYSWKFVNNSASIKYRPL